MHYQQSSKRFSFSLFPIPPSRPSFDLSLSRADIQIGIRFTDTDSNDSIAHRHENDFIICYKYTDVSDNGGTIDAEGYRTRFISVLLSYLDLDIACTYYTLHYSICLVCWARRTRINQTKVDNNDLFRLCCSTIGKWRWTTAMPPTIYVFDLNRWLGIGRVQGEERERERIYWFILDTKTCVMAFVGIRSQQNSWFERR